MTLRYDFEERGRKPLYEHLYECLKKDIEKGRLRAGWKLPSKRDMARDNGISVKTVMSAYDQLVMEGYLTSREKSGYFVGDVEIAAEYRPQPAGACLHSSPYRMGKRQGKDLLE